MYLQKYDFSNMPKRLLALEATALGTFGRLVYCFYCSMIGKYTLKYLSNFLPKLDVKVLQFVKHDLLSRAAVDVFDGAAPNGMYNTSYELADFQSNLWA